MTRRIHHECVECQCRMIMPDVWWRVMSLTAIRQFIMSVSNVNDASWVCQTWVCQNEFMSVSKWIHHECVKRQWCIIMRHLQDSKTQRENAWWRVMSLTASRSRTRSDLWKFGSSDSAVFPHTFLSDGDSVYSRETLFEILGTPEKMCLTCTGTPVETCWKCW